MISPSSIEIFIHPTLFYSLLLAESQNLSPKITDNLTIIIIFLY